MFERYSEPARRTLFFSRYEAMQFGAGAIEPEHLLLGVLRDSAQAVLRFVHAGETGETIRRRLEAALVAREPATRSGEVPFSPACKLVLSHGAAEADGLQNHTIRPEHLVLGILVATSGAAARVLREAAIDADAIREHLRAVPDDAPAYQTSQPVRALTAHAVTAAVVRQWKGVVKPGLANAYLTHLHQETIPTVTRLDGFLTVMIMRRDIEDGTEFQIVTVWRTLDAIKAFAGADITKAVVPPAAQALMVRYDDRAIHYDIVQ